MDQIEYIKSNKGGMKIIYKGYMYTVHKNKKCGGIRWRCTQRRMNCKGSISTTMAGSAFINVPHNHLPDYKSINTARSKSEDNLHQHLISNLLTLETTKYLADSMPLEQRLKVAPEPQEPVLQSQPLSPTKLKVTRQSTKPPQPSPKVPPPEPPNEEVCLRWNSHHSNMQTSFPSLLMREQYVDATLVAEGKSLKCHRMILSSCSPYFEEVLNGISPFQHPVLFMKDIPFWVLKSLCDFMYAGEVHIFQNKLEELLAVAESLKIKGLAGKMDSSNEETKPVETAKPVKEEKKEEKEKEVKEKKRNSQHLETPPKTSSKPVRSVHPSRKSEKVNKESLNKQGILDPLDLLEPVYEEVTKESAPPKLKEMKTIPMKRGKLKKRKISEAREESPPPLFLSRKGTRSRPNVKIPKYYHPHYERVPDATIVREPHTDQADPFFEIDEIKAEPLDLEDDVIEIEDNVIGFPNEPDIAPHDEEIIGNYDSPLVNLNDNIEKAVSSGAFKKINLVAQPIILNVHSISEKSPSSLQIVDLGRLKGTLEATEKIDDPLATVSDVEMDKTVEDPLTFEGAVMEKGITITNVQSMADLEESESEKNEEAKKDESEAEMSGFRIENVTTEKEDTAMEKTSMEISGFHIENVTSEKEDTEDATIEKDSNESEETAAISTIPVAADETEKIEEETSVTTDVSNVEFMEEDITEKNNETEPENSSQASASLISDISNNEPQVEVSHLEPEENLINDTDVDMAEPEAPVELGFHIAKVASEQFSIPANVDSAAVSEDCAGALGFQITHVVSGQIEDSEVRMPEETFSNHLPEAEGDANETGDGSVESNIAQSEGGGILSEETQFLAETLEKLLDE